MNLKRKQRQFLSGVSGCRSLCLCGTGHLPDATSIEMALVGEGKVQTKGSLFCKSTRCVSCSGKVAKKRALDITRVLCSKEIKSSSSIPYFITLTFQSGPGTALNRDDAVKQIRGFQKIWTSAKKRKFFLPRIYVAAVEYVVGQQWNAHIHVHVLAFYDEGSKWSPEETIRRWLVSAEGQGFAATRDCQHYRLADMEDKAKISRYVAKGSTSSLAAGVAVEMQGQKFKDDKESSRTPFALLREATADSLEMKAYQVSMGALCQTKLQTYRTSRRFVGILEEASALVGESSLEEEASLEVEREKVLIVPVHLWKEMNRIRLSDRLFELYPGCFFIRDIIEDLLVVGDRFLANFVVDILAKNHCEHIGLSKKDYECLLWKELEEILSDLDKSP